MSRFLIWCRKLHYTKEVETAPFRSRYNAFSKRFHQQMEKKHTGNEGVIIFKIFRDKKTNEFNFSFQLYFLTSYLIRQPRLQDPSTPWYQRRKKALRKRFSTRFIQWEIGMCCTDLQVTTINSNKIRWNDRNRS